jgi:hypothetical protein
MSAYLYTLNYLDKKNDSYDPYIILVKFPFGEILLGERKGKDEVI